MDNLERLLTIGQTAVRRLRKQKLKQGQPFLIWSEKLPKDQSYLEYPDRSIKIVTVAPNMRSFIIVKELTTIQAQAIRDELDLT